MSDVAKRIAEWVTACLKNLPSQRGDNVDAPGSNNRRNGNSIGLLARGDFEEQRGNAAHSNPEDFRGSRWRDISASFRMGRGRPRPRVPAVDGLITKAVPTCFVLAVCLASAAEAPRLDSPLPRNNVLLFHDNSGHARTVRTKADWAKRRAEILEAMQSIMGPLPGKEKRCDLEPKIESETDRGAYVERLMTYAAEPGGKVPAYLLIPKSAFSAKHKFPGILALHPTDMQFGHRVVVEDARNYYRAYGRDLAQRGYVVIAPAYPLMANYQPDLKALGYRSGTMKAIWDNMRALDLLETLPFVNKKKFGAIGHSLGGHNAIYTAVFDPRIKVLVSSCGFDSYRDYKNGDITGWTQERYMPELARYKKRPEEIPFDFYEMIAALAPRPVFINAPLGDSNFKWDSVDRIVREARKVYSLEGASPDLQVVHPDCAHDFPPDAREQAYKFIDAHLR